MQIWGSGWLGACVWWGRVEQVFDKPFRMEGLLQGFVFLQESGLWQREVWT